MQYSFHEQSPKNGSAHYTVWILIERFRNMKIVFHSIVTRTNHSWSSFIIIRIQYIYIYTYEVGKSYLSIPSNLNHFVLPFFLLSFCRVGHFMLFLSLLSICFLVCFWLMALYCIWWRTHKRISIYLTSSLHSLQTVW